MLKINHLRCFRRPVLGARSRFVCLFGAFFVLSGTILGGCGDRGERSEGGASRSGIEASRSGIEAAGSGAAESCSDSVTPAPMLYSKMLRMGRSCGVDVVDIRSIVGRDTLNKRFVLLDSAHMPDSLGMARVNSFVRQGATLLKVPLARVVALSSAQIGYMLRLGVEGRIVAVGAGRYVADSALYYRVKGNVPGTDSAHLSSDKPAIPAHPSSDKPATPAHPSSTPTSLSSIEQVSDGMNVDYEKLLALKPGLVMTFATGGSDDDYVRLERLGIPAMLTSEWQEDSPLAKAEWIKLYGKLFGTARSDSIFEQSKIAYEAERQRASFDKEKISAPSDAASNAPSGASPAASALRVLAGMSYGGVWYAPGGRSYTANLIKDAGGRYLWASDTTREMRLSLEEVMAIADSADVWVNPGMFATPEEILAAEPRASRIKAFAEKRVCQNDGRKGPGGGSDFYEGAVARPYDLLQNLTNCLSNSPKSGDFAENAFEWYHNIF